MALDTNDLLVVSKSSDGSLAKTTIEDLLALADGSSEVIIGETAPDLTNYNVGQLWWCSSDGNMYVKYVDTDGEPGQWVPINSSQNGSAGLIEEAPQDGKEYVRKDGAWVEITEGASQDIAFIFLDTFVITSGDSSSSVTANAVAIGAQPTNVTYQWVEFNSFNETLASATDIALAFSRSLSGDVPSKDRVNCRVTFTFADGSTKQVFSGSSCEVFTPIFP